MAFAIYKHARTSAQKAGLLVDMIRGRGIAEALDILNFSTKKAARLVKKTLDSAIANAEHNEGADIDELVVTKTFVNTGRKLKRTSPRAKGRGDRIEKSTCHITVTVEPKQ